MQIEYFHIFLQKKTSKNYYTFTAELKSPSRKNENFKKFFFFFFQKNHISFAGEILLNFRFCSDRENLDSKNKKRMLRGSDPYDLRKFPQAIHHQKIRPPCPPVLLAHELFKNRYKIREVQF